MARAGKSDGFIVERDEDHIVLRRPPGNRAIAGMLTALLLLAGLGNMGIALFDSHARDGGRRDRCDRAD